MSKVKIASTSKLTAIGKIKPYEANTKVHTPGQVEKLAALIAEYGWDQPIVVDGKGVIIKGHCRYMAAKHLELKRVPVVVRDDLSESQVRAARIADNKIAESEWDFEHLSAELADLAAFDVDLPGLGFVAEELGDLLDDFTVDTVPDEEEPKEETIPESVYQEQYAVVVICKNEDEQKTVYERLMEDGYNCKVVST